MQVNGKEIVRMPDVPLFAVKKSFKTTKKRPLSSALKNTSVFNLDHQPIRILERGSEISLAVNSYSSLLGLFQLFITKTHLALTAIHTNLNAVTKPAQDVYKKNQKLVMTDLSTLKKK